MVDKYVWTRFTYNLSHLRPPPSYAFKGRLKTPRSGDNEMPIQLWAKSITILNVRPFSHQSYPRIAEGNDGYGMFHTFFYLRKEIDPFLEMKCFCIYIKH